MHYLLLWWFVLLIIGTAALPVVFRFFQFLPDRGYAFSKPLGLLLIVYPFWLLTSFGFLENTFSSILLTLAVLAVAAWGFEIWRREFHLSLGWLREHLPYVLSVELIFAITLFAFAYYRSFNPEISATEKPMEFMFLNSILKSIRFPPHDSWLSGYAISYYYLGYVLVALLTKLTSVPSNFSFNLGLTMVYALSAGAAFGLGYNLVKGASSDSSQHPASEERASTAYAPYFSGLLAAVFLLVIGNLEAPFESLHNLGIGSDAFYSEVLDINGLAQAPRSGSFIPTDNWWWWRASRVVNDHNPITREHVEVIDEFPSFSFLLGDLHPHVLALPFDILALAYAYNLLRQPKKDTVGLRQALRAWFSPRNLLATLVVGSLGMLNTWDLVTYGFIIIAAHLLKLVRDEGGWSRSAWLEGLTFGVLLLIASYLLYLPFYIGFGSQVQGIMVAVFFKTPLHQFLIMFGLFVFVLAGYLGVLAWQRRSSTRKFLVEVAKWATLILAMPIAIAAIGLLVLARSATLRSQAASYLNSPNSEQVISDVLGAYVRTLAANPGVFILLTLMLSFSIAIARTHLADGTARRERGALPDASVLFAILLAFIGFGLALGVEFLYVLDTFGSRMNTVFKLYFQSWTILSAASAFGAYFVYRELRGISRALWVVALGLILMASLVFPVLAYPNRANDFKANAAAGIPTLDGTLWIKNSNPDDYAAIQWLNANAPDRAVVLEAPGPEYSFYDRISVATGLETVLGWGGHEYQWRGSGEEGTKREADVEAIYKAMDPNQARILLRNYGVDYVVVGGLEQEKYGLVRPMIDKFSKLGQLVFAQGSMQIFMINSQDSPVSDLNP